MKRRQFMGASRRRGSCMAFVARAQQPPKVIHSRDPGLNCCKNVTPVTGVWGLASAPERNRRLRIRQSDA